MKKWKCSVCGYIHTGDEPPEKCPVCGADRSKFVELPAEAPAPEPETAAAAEETRPVPEQETAAHRPAPAAKETLYAAAGEQLTRLHAHPISVHIPNGVLPLSALFLCLAMVFGCSSLATAAFWNLVFVAVFMPLVLLTGYNDWQRRYNGAVTSVFVTKIVCGAIVLCGTLLLAVWWAANPGILDTVSAARRLFLLIGTITVGAAVLAGYMGGKLVFPQMDA